jgi:hypothetical protein
MPPKTLYRVGLGCLFFAFAVYFSASHWLNTRIFDPLDYPVSLDTRHLQSPPFQINLNESYFVFLRLNEGPDGWSHDYRLDSQWRVYRFGRGPTRPRELWASSGEDNPQSPYRYAFQASPGQYQLEWDTSAAAPDLNSKNPRLHVFTGSSDYEWAVAVAQIFCVFLGGTGLALVVLATARATTRAFSRPAAQRMLPGMILRSVVSRAKHAPLQPIHCLPHLGLFYGSALWTVIFILIMIGQVSPSYSGFFVSVKSPTFIEAKSPLARHTCCKCSHLSPLLRKW